MLDFGAEGVIAPMINTEADARAFVAAAKFPPLGERSWGPHRATTLAGIADQKTYLRDANEVVVTLAMIETRTAMNNLAAIAATPGIDVLFVGPSDLSIALTDGATVDPHSVAVEVALEKVVAAARGAGKIAGLYCISAERAVACARRGFRFLAVGSDLAFLRAGTATAAKRARRGEIAHLRVRRRDDLVEHRLHIALDRRPRARSRSDSRALRATRTCLRAPWPPPRSRPPARDR